MRLTRRELFERFVPEVVSEKEQMTDAVPEMGGGVAVARLTRRTAILAGAALVAGVLTDCAAQKQIPLLPQTSGINPEHWAEMSDLERQLLTTLENQIASLNQICDLFFGEYDGVDSTHRDIGELDRMFHGHAGAVSGLIRLHNDVIDLYNAIGEMRCGENISPFFVIELNRLANLLTSKDEMERHLLSVRMGFRGAFGRFVTEISDAALMEMGDFSGVNVLLVNVDSIAGDDALHAFSVYTARNIGDGNLYTAMLQLEEDEHHHLNPRVAAWLKDDLGVTGIYLPTYVVIVDGRPVAWFHHRNALNAAMLAETVQYAVERFKESRENQEDGVNIEKSLDL